MCNSYSNGQCLYYGVSIKEMNYKCDRGDCMDNESTKESLLGILEVIRDMQCFKTNTEQDKAMLLFMNEQIEHVKENSHDT